MKNDISNLTHIVWETQKWHNNFRRVKVRSYYAAIASLRCRTAPYCTEINVTALRCRMKVKFNLPWNAVKLWWLAAESNRYIGTAMQVVWTLSGYRVINQNMQSTILINRPISRTAWSETLMQFLSFSNGHLGSRDLECRSKVTNILMLFESSMPLPCLCKVWSKFIEYFLIYIPTHCSSPICFRMLISILKTVFLSYWSKQHFERFDL